MALVNLKTKYTDLKWQYDGGVPHYDLKNPKKPRFADLKKDQQAAFYQNNIGKLLGPLETLRSQYKDKSFSSDQKLNGYSGLPYIKFNYDGTAIVGDTKIRTDNTSLVDFPVRGGNYPSRQIDFERIKTFMKSDKGALFVEKQKILQFMNPKSETGLSYVDPSTRATFFGPVGTTLSQLGFPVMGANVSNVGLASFYGPLENTRDYSVENTLTQVSLQGTGAHISRIGRPSFNVRDQFYGDIVGLQNTVNSPATNRLGVLRNLKIINNKNTFIAPGNNFLDIAYNTLFAKKLGISTNQGLLFNYAGGPTSNRSGNTTIARTVDTTLAANPTSMAYAAIAKMKNTRYSTGSVDFRSYTEKYGKSNPTGSTSIVWDDSKTIKTRLQTAVPIIYSPEDPEPYKTDYKFSIKQDELSILQAYMEEGDPYTNSKNPKDMIKFGFECMSNDRPGESLVLLFRAFLSAGLTDSNGAVLNPFRYFGRGEEFFTYQGFTRTVGFSFKIAVRSRKELQPLYAKLNALISQVYPDYTANKGIMRAPLVKLTIGDYLYRVPGFIESVNVTVDNATPWEINLEGLDDVQQLPHVVEVQVSFKPIHNVLPSRQINPGAIPNLITDNFVL